MSADAMQYVVAYIRPLTLGRVVDAVRRLPGFPGMSVMDVRGFGSDEAHTPRKGERSEVHPFEPILRLEVFCQSVDLIAVIEAIRNAAYTGHAGDGKIFAGPVDVACRIRSGETGPVALARAREL
jgi:nitrogen regulatory protein P-II 1